MGGKEQIYTYNKDLFSDLLFNAINGNNSDMEKL